ncbi:T9SS type A sorting domain-containing protein [uncultured Marixanthomonas sp.]|uniref:T9SS type A sorting domain-containing protein n=1 Tax=uncultured Marixanthomonas sp. TaxID=757245 RepID=UPI0030D89E1E|tara:strand:- start:305730 stop:307310 length:1581 start_codon:yes stop_codon:yes gene_type:complete
MKHLSTLTFLFFLNISSSLNAQDVLWEKSLGGLQAEYLFDAQPTDDFGFILAGSSVSDKSGNKQDKNIGNLDYWIWKMDEHGGLDWQKSFGGDGLDLLNKVLTTRDGGFLLAGSSTSSISDYKKEKALGLEDFWVIKLNADGSEQWQKTLGGSGSDILKTAIEMPMGGYLIAGSSSSPMTVQKKGKSFGNKDYWVIRLNTSGEVEWDISFGGKYVDEVEAICPAPQNGVYVLGYSNSGEDGNKTTEPLGSGDYWLLRLDGKGNLLWQKSFGGEGDDHPYAALQLKDGNIIVGGVSSSQSSTIKQANNKNGTDFWIFKLDDSGTIIWEETYDIGEYDMLSSIEENKDGTILLGGYAKSEKVGLKRNDSKGINDYVAIKIDTEGEEKWRQEVGSNGDDVLQRLVETRDGGYVLAGTSNGVVSGERNSSQGRHDFWVVKLGDKDKDDDETSSMAEAYPNPTSGFTNVIITSEFETGEAFLYDIRGRQLQHYILSSRTLPVDLRGLPIGVYLVNIETNVGSDSVKILKKD